MKSVHWKEIVEIIGVASIVGSLIFVGLQMRQSHEIALSAAYQSRSDSSLQFRTAIFESPALLSAFTKMRIDRNAELTPDEQSAFDFFFYSNLIYLENIHYQYISGFVSEEQWQSNVLDIEDLLSYPRYRYLWGSVPGRYRSSFVAVMDAAALRVDQRKGAD